MGNVSVSSCRCCMFVSCVYHVAVLNAVFCMFVNRRGILQSRSHDCLIGIARIVSFCLSHPVAVSAFIICIGLCACTEML